MGSDVNGLPDGFIIESSDLPEGFVVESGDLPPGFVIPKEEPFLPHFGKGLLRSGEHMVAGLGRGISAMGEQMVESAVKPTTTVRRYKPTGLGTIPVEETEEKSPLRRKIDQALIKFGSSAQRYGQEIRDFYTKAAATGFEAPPPPEVLLGWGTLKRGALAAAESAAPMAAAAAVTALTKSPLAGASTFFPQAYGDMYEEARRHGKSPEAAGQYAMLNAASQVGLETIPLGRWMRGGNAFKRIARTAIAEGLVEEGAQQIVTNGLRAIGWVKPKNIKELYEVMTDGLAESVVAGTLLGGALGAVSPPTVADRISDKVDQWVQKNGKSFEKSAKLQPDEAQRLYQNTKEELIKQAEIVAEKMQPTTFKNKTEIKIPEFGVNRRGTEQAIFFGEMIKGNSAAIAALKERWDAVRLELENLKKASPEDDALYALATKNQLYREAYQRATGSDVDPVESDRVIASLKKKGYRLSPEGDFIKPEKTIPPKQDPILKSALRKQQIIPKLERLNQEAIEKGDVERQLLIQQRLVRLAMTPEETQAFKNYQRSFMAEKDYPGISQPAPALSPQELASVGTTAENIPVKPAQLKPIETIEMIQLAQGLMGKPPAPKALPKSWGTFTPKEQGSIALNRELFVRGNEKQLASTLAHEIGHLVDYLPEHDLKRGNVYGHLLSLKHFMEETFLNKAVTNKEVSQELKNLTQVWKPFDEEFSSSGYVRYRYSAVELYADFVSVLFNNPGLAQEVAPKSFDLFFEGLDKKPAAKQAYFAIQDLLNGMPQAILTRRQENIREMFVRGKELRLQKEKEKQLMKVNYWERLRQLVDDINRPIIAKRQKAQSKGEFLPSEESPEYELEEHSLVDNDNFSMVADIDANVLKPIKDAGLDEFDLGEFMFLKRIEGDPNIPTLDQLEKSPFFQGLSFDEQQQLVNLVKRWSDRMDIANPQGFAPNTATQQLDSLRQQIGEEKFAVLEAAAQKYHDIVFKIVTEAVEVGSYSREVFQNVIVPNRNRYVTFGVLQYLQDYVPAGIKMQKGTLAEVENPFITTTLKMISLNRLNSRQRAMNQLRDWLRGSFPEDIKPAGRTPTGNFIDPQRSSGKALIHLLENGRRVAYEVDEYIAKSVENSKSGDVMLVGHLINKVFGNQIFKSLYITYNPGFAFAFNPIRDFKRAYANLNALGQNISVGKLMRAYAEALPSALRRQRGIPDETIREMMDIKALDVPFIDFNFEIHGDAYHGIMRQLGLLKGEEHLYAKKLKGFLKPLLQIMEGIRFMGSTIESLSKVASYNVLKESGKFKPKEIAYITRNYVGTPNYRRGGSITSVTNAVWIFSNVMKEGLKTDAQLALHPKTRSGFWWAHFKVNMLPKFLMYAAATGWGGEELKKFFEKVSEYDKTNYVIIPLGEDSRGKAIYMRIPHDESGRLMSAMFWKVLMGLQEGDPQQVQQIFAFGAGQLPGLAPGIEISNAWITYLSGKNPYDSFRGQYLISDTAWKAGGWPALKKMVQWTTNNTGILQFATYDDSKQTTFESIIQSTPGLNRLLKASDFGITESLREQREDFQQKQAQLTLRKRDLVDKGAERIRQGEPAHRVARKIAADLYGKPSGERIRQIRKALSQEETRGDDVYLDMLMTAQTNEEKEQILRQMRLQYDPVRMRELERQAIRIKAASPTVIMKSRRSP